MDYSALKSVDSGNDDAHNPLFATAIVRQLFNRSKNIGWSLSVADATLFLIFLPSTSTSDSGSEPTGLIWQQLTVC